ncbi:MAG: hypothetical protein AAGI12_10645 [Pseudomonadota bacterium]
MATTEKQPNQKVEQRVGLLALGRATFDVAFAEERFATVLSALDAAPISLVGPRELLFDGDAARTAIEELKAQTIDRLLIAQITFTDAAVTVEAAKALGVPISIWAVPEPRRGSRLRLNAFCGLNLASHALGINRTAFSWAYGDAPDVDVMHLLSDRGRTTKRFGTAPTLDANDEAEAEASAITERLRAKRIARLGPHPDGFDTCRYGPAALDALAGVSVDEYEISDLFDRANALPETAEAPLKAQLDSGVGALDSVDGDELARSLRLKLALDAMRSDHGYDAFAIRCWPETFTEYGGAVCGPVSLMGGARVPCACEADIYGALTQLILQDVADAPVFLADMVDVDTNDNSVVVWHCGQAPLDMAAPNNDVTATIHTNRKMPLLMEFTLKPGRVTLMRISQAHGQTQMILSSGTVLDRPMSFTGTSGVITFDTDAQAWMEGVFDSGLEHHMALAYGDHRDALMRVAAALDLRVLEL